MNPRFSFDELVERGVKTEEGSFCHNSCPFFQKLPGDNLNARCILFETSLSFYDGWLAECMANQPVRDKYPTDVEE